MKNQRPIRTLKAWWLRSRRRRQRGEQPPAPVADRHTCIHCGFDYEGRYCPQCGLSGKWTRFTWARLAQGFLNIWGMGERSFFRTVRDLLLRPGYMIRDYLTGHHLFFFPPFKMLAVTTIIVSAMGWLTGTHHLKASEQKDTSVLSPDNHIFAAFVDASQYLKDHKLYAILLFNLFIIVAVWAAFSIHNKGRRLDNPQTAGTQRGAVRLNFVETVLSQTYIIVQLQLVTIAAMIPLCFFPSLRLGVNLVATIVCITLLITDYRQLYGMSRGKTLLRVTLSLVILALLFLIVLIAIAILILVGDPGDLQQLGN